jgi:hypothetical protein
MSKTEKAVKYMVSLIESGWEYPDAEWKTLDRFRSVSQRDLMEMYDTMDFGALL